MKVIKANCRDQLTAADVDFILSVLSPERGTAQCLVHLLSDPDLRDTILDQEALYRAMLDQPSVLTISAHLYFYVLVRHVLMGEGIDDRETADYVAEMLSEFSVARKQGQSEFSVPGGSRESMVDLMLELASLHGREAFGMHAHIGNVALFLSGVFLKRIQHCLNRRAAPDVDYYESIGRMQFRVAKDDPLAERYHLESVFGILSGSFHEARLALNDLTDRLVSCGEPIAAPGVVI